MGGSAGTRRPTTQTRKRNFLSVESPVKRGSVVHGLSNYLITSNVSTVFVLLDAYDSSPDPYRAPSPLLPDESPSSNTSFIDQAYQEVQRTIDEGNAVLSDVSAAATRDSMMDDETAHKKRGAGDML